MLVLLCSGPKGMRARGVTGTWDFHLTDAIRRLTGYGLYGRAESSRGYRLTPDEQSACSDTKLKNKISNSTHEWNATKLLMYNLTTKNRFKKHIIVHMDLLLDFSWMDLTMDAFTL